MSHPFDQDLDIPLTSDEQLGKNLVEKIRKAKKEFRDETDASPNLLLIHPASMKLINQYAYKVEAFTYQYVNRNDLCMPDDPSLFVIYDYYRLPGSFLVTSRKLLERSGIAGGGN